MSRCTCRNAYKKSSNIICTEFSRVLLVHDTGGDKEKYNGLTSERYEEFQIGFLFQSAWNNET